MKLATLNRHGLLAAALAAAIAVGPVTVFHRGSASAAPPGAPAVLSGADASTARPELPDFSAMVQKYGPAVVNVTVTKKMAMADSEADDAPGEDDPFGPNSPFAPFSAIFRSFRRSGRSPLRCKAKARGSSPAPMD